MSRSPAYRLIDAWPLAERLSPMGDKLNERQVRKLLPLRQPPLPKTELYSTTAHETAGFLLVIASHASFRHRHSADASRSALTLV
jgi:hypothetical protein